MDSFCFAFDFSYLCPQIIKKDGKGKYPQFSYRPIAGDDGYGGFSSQSHFSTVFKKQFGTSPSEYK
jgi:YesN/AraC family two-component response regulator